MRVTSFILFFDEFSYYTYHTTHYDRGFRVTTEFCWNITNFKWVPSFLDDAYSRVSNTFNFMLINDSSNVTPVNLQYGGDTLFFINNIQQYLLVTTTTTVLVCVFLRLARRRLPVVFSKLLKPFSLWSCLLASLVGDNAQYISFRFFEQLRYFVPRQGFLGYANLVLLLAVQLIVVVCCCCMYLLFRRYTKLELEMPALDKSLVSCSVVSSMLATKSSTGLSTAISTILPPNSPVSSS